MTRPADRGSRPIAFAHRGARAERPENTLPAFTRALELGATGLESDAWITSDGVVVLDHDGVAGGPGQRRIRDVTRAQLPSHIPTLEALYESCGTGFELSLDVKDPQAFRPVVAVADRFEATSRLWLCYPDAPTLAGWRRSSGTSRLVHSTRIPVRSRPPGVARRALAEYLDLAKRSEIDAVNMRARGWDKRSVDALHEAGMLVFAWDAQRGRQIARMLRLGVDGLYSDRPELAVAAIATLCPIPGATNHPGASQPPDAGYGPHE